jgi:hypothetical protein
MFTYLYRWASTTKNLMRVHISFQVDIYFEEYYDSLSKHPLSQHFDKSWVAHVQLKATTRNTVIGYAPSEAVHLELLLDHISIVIHNMNHCC